MILDVNTIDFFNSHPNKEQISWLHLMANVRLSTLLVLLPHDYQIQVENEYLGGHLLYGGLVEDAMLCDSITDLRLAYEDAEDPFEIDIDNRQCKVAVIDDDND